VHGGVEPVEVIKAPVEITEPVDSIVVGGPTYVFCMARTSTREDAFTQGPS